MSSTGSTGNKQQERRDSDLNWFQRYHRTMDGYPWWVRFCVVWTIITASLYLVDGVKAVAAPLPASVAVTQQHSKTDRCVLEDPERPCWATPHNMNHYFHHGHTHGFEQLSSRFKFPSKFIHVAQQAHADWCQIHSRLCKAQIERFKAEGLKTSDDCYWWCMYRNGLDENGCAIGYSVAQWECDSGLHQRNLRMHLSHTEWVVIGCAGETLIGGLIGRMVGAAMGASLCSFHAYTEWADDREGGLPSRGSP